jgi:hypothetical protein
VSAIESILSTAAHLRQPVFRNISTRRQSVDLSAELGGEAGDDELYAGIEQQTRPRLRSPIVNRPFEDGYSGVVMFPFVAANFASTRFSDGTYGAWYGSTQIETTVYETVYHSRRNLIEARELPANVSWPIVTERRVHEVPLDALLFDLRGKVKAHPALIDPSSYSVTQQVGRAAWSGGHPGLLVRSARCDGDNVAVFTPRVLGEPAMVCYLTYKLFADRTVIERQLGRAMLKIPAAGFDGNGLRVT